nr:Gfo/Idh/MocA family oxidoreductase [bacterium]
MKTLRTLVSGLGRIGWDYHLPNLKDHPGFEIAGAADPDTARANEVAAAYGIPTFGRFEDMLQAVPADLAVICSPTMFHAPQAIAAMEHGLDVFIDKPIAQDLSACDAILETAKRTGRCVMCYQPQRESRECQVIRHILQDGRLGPVYMIKASRCDYWRRNDWQALKKNGGGMLNNYGAHLIDMLMFATQSRATRVSAYLNCQASLGDADDVVKLMIDTTAGILLDLDINMATAYPLMPLTVMGKYGTLQEVTDSQGTRFKARWFDPKEVDSDLALEGGLAAGGRKYKQPDRLPWREETIEIAIEQPHYYDYCYDYFALDKPAFCPVEQTRELMRIIDLARRDAAR